MYQLVLIIQSFMAFIIGALAAHAFKFSGPGVAITGISAMLGSGAIQYKNGQVFLQGIGDIINIILVVILACFLFLVLKTSLVH